ncbi:hypothetical protein BZA05DRAFT_190640 [Tricharina praecox]|uniref:uncharacterized protein n=1 Tax=Tricharina praecox TaxID=43433 RepID=UPI002220C166|nr:uncharacterized protein BZA05DRAFT_190640 [Tricharina praecox]KAI5842789.1 hypothetical protein BZA05DRAFT_190640 [Tricharina praecox]
MESLTITAAVVGLLRVAPVIIRLLSGVTDAPSTVRNVLIEVSALHAIFLQLENFVVTFAEQNTDRKSRIYVEDLMVTLTGYVCAFSELDMELGGLGTAGDGDGNGDGAG